MRRNWGERERGVRQRPSESLRAKNRSIISGCLHFSWTMSNYVIDNQAQNEISQRENRRHLICTNKKLYFVMNDNEECLIINHTNKNCIYAKSCRKKDHIDIVDMMLSNTIDSYNTFHFHYSDSQRFVELPFIFMLSHFAMIHLEFHKNKHTIKNFFFSKYKITS